jgi:hypothetical protein
MITSQSLEKSVIETEKAKVQPLPALTLTGQKSCEVMHGRARDRVGRARQALLEAARQAGLNEEEFAGWSERVIVHALWSDVTKDQIKSTFENIKNIILCDKPTVTRQECFRLAAQTLEDCAHPLRKHGNEQLDNLIKHYPDRYSGAVKHYVLKGEMVVPSDLVGN